MYVHYGCVGTIPMWRESTNPRLQGGRLPNPQGTFFNEISLYAISAANAEMFVIASTSKLCISDSLLVLTCTAIVVGQVSHVHISMLLP